MITRRQFCRSAVAAGVTASMPFTVTLSRAFATTGAAIADIPAIRLDGGETMLEKAAIRELGEGLRGALLASGDADYDDARTIWNGMHDKHPALIARCADIEDVANAVNFARERQLLLSVKGGGHSFPGKCVAEGGFMIDLSDIEAVHIDVESKRATVGGGALLQDLDNASQIHGLATTTGVVSHTGVGGLTLGGGFGRLNRKYGLTIDNLVSANMVTADGKMRRVSEDENSDLFWAIRGGGGNFGVVTDFEFELHQIGTEVLGGNIVWPMNQAREVLEFYADYSSGLSDEMYTGPGMGLGPDGNATISIEVTYCGDMAAGEKELAPLRKVGKPIADDVGAVSYMTLQTVLDAPTRHGQRYYIKNGMVKEFTPGLIDALSENPAPAPGFMFGTHTAGGAVARVPEQATAWPHRNAQTMMLVLAIWTDEAEDQERIRTLKQWWSAIEPHTGGYYSNLQTDAADQDRGNFGPNFERLVTLKNRYDPMNLFRLNANIRPTV